MNEDEQPEKEKTPQGKITVMVTFLGDKKIQSGVELAGIDPVTAASLLIDLGRKMLVEAAHQGHHHH
jgi:hypothetical protein